MIVPSLGVWDMKQLWPVDLGLAVNILTNF